VKLHGLTEAEVTRVKADVLADLETAFLERHQTPSADFIGEAVDHFLRQEPLMDLEEELNLCKQVTAGVTAAEASTVAQECEWSRGCLCTVRMPKAKQADTVAAAEAGGGETSAAVGDGCEASGLQESEIRAVFAEVAEMSASGAIGAWKVASSGQALLPATLPPVGSVTSRHDFPEEGVTDVTLSNGLRVLLKVTDFLDDDISFSASSWTGLSNLETSQQMAGKLARPIADELGWAGIPREELLDLLAGLRISVSPSISAYHRGVGGNCSPSDLEKMLQLMHRLFTCKVRPDGISATE
jgi:hypothetical protein